MVADKQKGVSLIITLFIMIIILGVVLFISALLYSEVKIIKNIGDSMIAFYAADSGAEKVLYYDRQVIPEGAARGICKICDAFYNCTPNTFTTGCETCSVALNSADANGCTKCTNCAITFKTTMATTPQKYYNATVNVSTSEREGQCPLSLGQLKSVGTHLNTSRAVYLSITGDVKTGFGQNINDAGTRFTGNGNTIIHFEVDAPGPPTLPSLKAYVFYSATEDGEYILMNRSDNPVDLEYNNGLKKWQKNFNTNTTGYFSVSVGGIDSNGYCTSIAIIINN